MAGLHWMAVTLALLLSAGNSLAAVDQNQLAEIVKEILNRYRPSYENGRYNPMFSLAVSIPYNSDTKKYDISRVTDNGEKVRKKIVDCEVYTSERLVAATVLRWPNVSKQCPGGRVQWDVDKKKCLKTVKTWADVKRRCPEAFYDGKADHAEYRTLQHLSTLVNNEENEQDLLLFYVLASPCNKRCTNKLHEFNILTSINEILKWKNYAVVFSYVFKPHNKSIPENDLRRALEQLGRYQGPLGSIGLENIFRCKKNGEMHCSSCSSENGVARYCFSNDESRGPSNNKPSTSSKKPQQGGSDYPSQSGQSGSGGGKGRGKKKKNTSKDAGVSSSQSGLELSKTNVDSKTGGGQGGRGRGKAKKVGGRREGKKRTGGGNMQKSKQAQGEKKTQKSKKMQSKGSTQ